MQNPANPPPQHGFSVATLLLLTAIVAICFAAVETSWMQLDKLDHTKPRGIYPWSAYGPSEFEQQVQEIALRAVGGAVIGAIVGIAVGATRPRPFLGLLLAVPIGALVGAAICGVFTTVENIPLALVGSVLLILVGVGIRIFSRRRP
jgi:hypothetical protein